MWRMPVTFGGGMTTVKWPSPSLAGAKAFASSQALYIWSSKSLGLYVFDSSTAFTLLDASMLLGNCLEY